MGSKTGLSEIPNVQIGSQSGGNVQIGSLPNMERFHLESSTAGSLEAQLRAGKSICTGMPQRCRHGFLNRVSYFSKSNFPTADTPFLLLRFLTFAIYCILSLDKAHERGNHQLRFGVDARSMEEQVREAVRDVLAEADLDDLTTRKVQSSNQCSVNLNWVRIGA